MSLHLIATYIGLAAIWAFVLLSIILHVLPNDHSPLRHGLRVYGSAHQALTKSSFVLLGIGAGLVDLAAVASIGGGKRVAVGVLFFALFALGQIVRAFLAVDAQGAEPSGTGRAHGWVSAISYASMFVGVIAATPTLYRVQHWIAVYRATSLLELGVVIFTLLLAITRIKALRVVFGLVDRLFYLFSAAWFSVLALHFLRIPR